MSIHSLQHIVLNWQNFYMHVTCFGPELVLNIIIKLLLNMNMNLPFEVVSLLFLTNCLAITNAVCISSLNLSSALLGPLSNDPQNSSFKLICNIRKVLN